MYYICANPSEIKIIASQFERQGGDLLVREGKKFLVLQRITGMSKLTFSAYEKAELAKKVRLKNNFRKLFEEQRGDIDFGNEEPFNYI